VWMKGRDVPGVTPAVTVGGTAARAIAG